jgi:hypothetical protein
MAGASIAMKILTSPAGCRRRPLYDCRLARALVTVPPLLIKPPPSCRGQAARRVGAIAITLGAKTTKHGAARRTATGPSRSVKDGTRGAMVAATWQISPPSSELGSAIC